MKFVTSEEATHSIGTVLTSLERAAKYQGLFYNWYDTQTGEVLNKEDKQLISTVDNGWLAAGLLTVMAACSPELAVRAKKLVMQMNFPLLYNKERNLFYGGYYPDTREPSSWHYDILNTEARIASYIGIGLFGIPEINYSRLGKIAPADTEVSPQNTGQMLRSWGGSMFEALMPTLFVPEQESLMWEESHQQTIEAQMRYGRQNGKGYWGYSPSNTPSGAYQEAGLAELAIKEGGYQGDGKKLDVVTPHALCLGLLFKPAEAASCLKEMEKEYPNFYKPGFGFSDSVDVQKGTVANSYLSLDLAMSLISFYNATSENQMQRYFSSQLGGVIGKLIASVDNNQKLAA